VHLDAVQPGGPRPPRAGGERPLDRLDVRLRRLLGLEAVQGVGLVRRAQAFAVGEGRDVPLPARVGELDDIPAAVLVDALAELAPEGDAFVLIDRREAPTPPRANLSSQLIRVCVPVPS
jgi:hypothetical protein